MQIWKYPVPVELKPSDSGMEKIQEFSLMMPTGGKVVHVDVQENLPTIWVEVDPTKERVARPFLMVTSGVDVPPGWKYRGTAVLWGVKLVAHIFEIIA